MKFLLQARSLNKKYGSFHALKDFSIDLPTGVIYGILGPNGAGKTTFIRMLNQIILPDSGEIFFENELLQPKHSSLIGYMPEERGLYKNMAIGEQMMYFAQLKGLSHREAKKNVRYWLGKLRIEDWWNKKISELSKGMAQKIQFIVTVLHQPKLIIFDEPFSGFDPLNAALIKDEILDLKKNGATIIFSTHRMDTVEELCDYVALINKSKKVLDGNINAIKQRFKQNRFIAELIPHDKGLVLQKMEQLGLRILQHENDSIRIEFQATNNEDIHNILSFLTQHGRLIYFSEQIPTMNDIFIQTVKEKP